MIFKPEVRVRVDWNNDGFLNAGVPSGTSANLIPYAAYAAGAKCAHVIDDIHYKDNEQQDIDLYGFTRYDVDFDFADRLEIGSFGSIPLPPDDSVTNVLKVEDYLTANRKFLKVDNVDAPYFFEPFEFVVTPDSSGDLSFSEDIPTDSLIDLDAYSITAWVRAKYISGGSLNSEIAINTDGLSFNVDSGSLSSDTWSAWTEIAGYLKKNVVSDTFTISVTDTGVNADTLIRVQIGGFMAIKQPEAEQTFEGDAIAASNNVSANWTGSPNFWHEATVTNVTDPKYFDLDTSIVIPDGYRVAFNASYDVTIVNSSNNITVHLINDDDNTILGSAPSVGNSSALAQAREGTLVTSENNSGSDINVRVRFQTDEATVGHGFRILNLKVNYALVPSSYWRNDFNPTKAQGYVELTSGQAHNYSFVMWHDGVGSQDVDLAVYGLDVISNNITELVTDTISITTSPVRYNITIPSQMDDYIFNAKFTSLSTDTFSIKGNQVTSGTNVTLFNVGEVPHLDDITAYVKSAEWELGRNDFDSPLAYEGTLTLIINNDNGYFSMNNPNSPYFGYMRKNLKVVFEVKHNYEWHTLWSGWTSEFEVLAGRTGSREMTIRCQQGMYRLREGEFSYRPKRNTTVTDVVKELVANSGWRSAKNPFNFVLGFDAVLGINTYMQASSDIFTTIDTTDENIELAGMDWGKETEISKALNDILEAENAKLWIDREGGLVLRKRDHIINAVDKSIADITLDTETQNAEYVFGKKIVNRIEVIYEPKNEIKNAVVWKTKAPLIIPRRNARNIYKKSTIRVPMHFTFEEQRQRTITNLRTRMADFDITVINLTTGVEVTDISGNIWVSVTSDGDAYYELQVRNEFAFAVSIDIVVYGDYLEGGQPQTYIIEDIEAQEQLQAVHKETIKTSVLSSFEKAKNLAEWRLKRYAYATGMFNTIEHTVDGSSALARLIEWKLGSIIRISEQQTGETNKHHIIIAEQGSYQAGDVVRITQILENASDTYYNKVGYSTTGMGTLNHAPEDDILTAELMATDKAEVQRVGYLSEVGDNAIRMVSYRLGGSVWFGNQAIWELGKVGAETTHYREYAVDNSLLIDPYAKGAKRSFFNRHKLRGQPFASNEIVCVWGIWSRNRGHTIPSDIYSGIRTNIPEDTLIRLSMAVLDGDNSANHAVWWELKTTANSLIPSLATYDYSHPVPAEQALSLNNVTKHFTDEFIFKVPANDEGWWVRATSYRPSASDNNGLYFQDASYMNLRELNNTALLENTEYYINLWGACDGGQTVDIEVVVIEHDTLTEHTVPLTITDLYGKFGGTITTSLSLNDPTVSVQIKFVDVELDKPIYITGFAITETDIDTLAEANVRQDTAAHIFV